MKYYGYENNKIDGRKQFKKNDNLHGWICDRHQVVNSPLTNDHVNIKDYRTG